MKKDIENLINDINDYIYMVKIESMINDNLKEIIINENNKFILSLQTIILNNIE
jgi:hypothetical protein